MKAMIGEKELTLVYDHWNAILHGSEKKTTVRPAKQENLAMQYSCAGCLFNVAE